MKLKSIKLLFAAVLMFTSVGCIDSVQLKEKGNLSCEYSGIQVADCQISLNCNGLDGIQERLNGTWNLCNGSDTVCTVNLDTSTVTK